MKLMLSFEVYIRISQPSKVMFTSAKKNAPIGLLYDTTCHSPFPVLYISIFIFINLLKSDVPRGLFCLFDLIFYVSVNSFFSYVGMGFPGLN